MNTKAVAFGLVIALVLTVGTVSALSNSGGGNWGYYKEIWIKENSGTSLSDYQVLVELEPTKFPDKAKSDGSDLRFTEDGKELSYWVEEYNVSTKTARIWVEVQSIPANGEAKVTMYYGNPDAGAVSDGNATFVFFDDFESGNLSKWSMVQNAEITSTEVYSGAYSLKSHYDNQGLDNDVYFNLPIALEYQFKDVSASNNAGWGGFGSSIPGQRNDFVIGTGKSYNNWCFFDGSYHESDVPRNSDWNKAKIIVRESDILYYVNDALLGSTLSYSTSSFPRRIQFYSNSGPSDRYYDIIFLRKYTSSEPTIALSQEFPRDYGLVAEWHFDEGSGNIVTDSSGNGNDGIKYGATWTTGISENALEFDGVDDYVEISNEENFDFSVSDPFTLMAWVKTIESSYYALYLGNIIGKYDLKNYNLGYDFGAYMPADEKNVVPAFGIHKDWENYKFRYGNTDASDGNWHLFVATYDGSKTLAGIKLYVDGAEESYNVIEKGTVSTMLNNEKLLIGTRTIGSCHFNGTIDEVAIYNRTLTSTEIKAHYEEKKSTGLVAEWHFDEGSGNVTEDSSGNGNDGIIYGATWTTGVSGTALEFDGVNDYVTSPDSDDWDFGTDDFTIETWIYLDSSSSPSFIPIICWGEGASASFPLYMNWAMFLNDSKFHFYRYDGTETYKSVSWTPLTNTWYHIAVVRSGNALNFFVDGSQQGTAHDVTGVSYGQVSADPLYISRFRRGHGSIYDYPDGTIDEVRIYNRALTSDEIKTHYEKIKPAEEIATKQKIAFASDRSGNSDIWMMDPDGTNLEQLTTNTSSDTSPQISPDGTKIAFLSDRTGTWQVWLMNTDGSNHYKLFDVKELPIQYEYEKRVNYPTWAPDASYLITHIELVGEVHSAPWAAIYRHDPDGSNPQLFLDWGPSINGKFSISSDGRKFAYCREDSSYWTPTLKISVGNIVEGVVDETSINNLNVTIDGLVDEDVVWFSNGNKLMWSKSSNSEGYGIPQNLYSMNIDETDIKKLTTFTDKYARMPDFAPDEQKVVFTVSNETTAGIYTMNANGSGVQALLVDEYKNSGPCWGNVVVTSLVLFDTGEGTYPSISGTHNGTIKPSRNFTVNRMYTYPCAGTGGHTDSIELYEGGILIANGTWNGYSGDNQNVTIHNVTGNSYVTLLKGHEYNYTIKTGSYPQIIHKQSHATLDGSVITCTEFIDVNGKRYDDWIPAIALTYSDTSNTSDAVLILHFDEGSGTIAKDESGYGNDGTIYGAKWVDGKYGKALEFDGKDDYVDIQSVDIMRTNSAKSVFAWVKMPDGISDVSWAYLRSVVDDTLYSHWRMIGVAINGDTYRPTVHYQKDQVYLYAPPISHNEWHYIGFTWSPNYPIKLYVDGVMTNESESIAYWDTVNGRGHTYIGRQNELPSTHYFEGAIDEVRIYNRTLTADEIKRHYEG